MIETGKPAAEPQLDPHDFQTAEYVRNIYRAEIGDNITRAQVLNPAFWAHIATKLRPYDEITVIRTDGTLYARFCVLAAERTWARVHVLEWHDLTTRDVSLSQAEPTAGSEVQSPKAPEPDPSKTFKIQKKGERLKWCVIRQSDGQTVHEGEASKTEAQAWLDGYVKAIA